jgi:hypothetical protein
MVSSAMRVHSAWSSAPWSSVALDHGSRAVFDEWL